MNPIAKAARELSGVRFRHQGRSAETGVDCVGLWVVALETAGVPVEDFRAYRKFPSGDELRARMRRQFDPVTRAEPGDALMLRVPRHVKARHLAVYVGDGKMAHAESSIGRVIVEPVPWSNVDAIYRAGGPD